MVFTGSYCYDPCMVYPCRPSLFNHSCLPNCVAVFDGRVLKIRTIEDIKPEQQVSVCMCVAMYVYTHFMKEETDQCTVAIMFPVQPSCATSDDYYMRHVYIGEQLHTSVFL